MSMTTYLQTLKTLADVPRDVDQPASDVTLVLATLRGLNKKFAVMVTIVPMQTPFPSFIVARLMLLLEEVCQAEVAKANATVSSHLLRCHKDPTPTTLGPRTTATRTAVVGTRTWEVVRHANNCWK